MSNSESLCDLLSVKLRLIWRQCTHADRCLLCLDCQDVNELYRQTSQDLPLVHYLASLSKSGLTTDIVLRNLNGKPSCRTKSSRQQ